MKRIVVGAAGAGLLVYCVALVQVSDLFPAPGSDSAPARHVMLFVAATLAVALLHVGACVVAHRSPPRMFYVLVVAGLARLILLFGAPAPILEGDHPRLRFDARMVNQSLNPYEFKPGQLRDVSDTEAQLTGPQAERLRLARASMTASEDAPRPDEVLRPDLHATVTPVGLWLGSIADRFKPRSTRGFAFLVLVADVIAIYLLVIALRAMALPLSWVLVYAWSPILLKEAYLTLAPDVFLMPLLAGLVCCIATGRRLLAAVPLAFAAGVRFPFLLLMPLFARRTGFLGILLAVLLFVGPFLPFVATETSPAAFLRGQIHVWRHYEYQSLVENLVRGGLGELPNEAENTMEIAGVPVIRPGELVYPLLAKLLCIVILLGAMVYLVIRVTPPPDEDPDAEQRTDFSNLFVILAVMLAVSPVLHPWHAIWLLPILVVRPAGLSWLMLPGLLTLGYLTHLVGPQAADVVFAGGFLSIRVLTFGLFFALFLVDLRYRDRIFVPPPTPKRRIPDEVTFTEEDAINDFVLAEEPVARI